MKKEKKVYIETYGCQMNLADSEVILSILTAEGYTLSENLTNADLIFVNTCCVRENAERRVYDRLGYFKHLKTKKPDVIIGVLGCMAESIRNRIFDESDKGLGSLVDLIVGPDEYRKLPELILSAQKGEKGFAVQLSFVETYEDIIPLRVDGVCAWIPVMRGCDKFCSYCVVPFVRGHERSRSLMSIIREVEYLSKRGFKEVTLLGQNVNSYRDGEHDFAYLLKKVSSVDPTMRIRYLTSHPMDMSDKIIEEIAAHHNICKHIHLPIQSGSDRILELMNRNYNKNHYLNLVKKIRYLMPEVNLTTDIITGFPTETENDHKETIDLMNEVKFDGAYMFKYSPRKNTTAFKMVDDVHDEIKIQRLNEIISLQNEISNELNQKLVGKTMEVLVEGESKKSANQYQGRTGGNKVVIFQKGNVRVGDYISVNIQRANSATLFGNVVEKFQDQLIEV